MLAWLRNLYIAGRLKRSESGGLELTRFATWAARHIKVHRWAIECERQLDVGPTSKQKGVLRD